MSNLGAYPFGRLCPECFAPVEMIEEGADHKGTYEDWRCTAPGADKTHHAQRDPFTKRGVYRLREKDYLKAQKKRNQYDKLVDKQRKEGSS